MSTFFTFEVVPTLKTHEPHDSGHKKWGVCGVVFFSVHPVPFFEARLKGVSKGPKMAKGYPCPLKKPPQKGVAQKETSSGWTVHFFGLLLGKRRRFLSSICFSGPWTFDKMSSNDRCPLRTNRGQ